MSSFHHFFYIKTELTTSRSPGTTKLGSEHIAAFSSMFRFQIWLGVMKWQDIVVEIKTWRVKLNKPQNSWNKQCRLKQLK